MAPQLNIKPSFASQAGSISVLLVAPKSDLKTNEELNRIARSGISLQVLDGDDVTGESLMIYLASVRPDVVHFGQHGNVETLTMSDGPMTPPELIAMLQCITLSFIVVNACTSLAIASDLHTALNVPVVAHPVEIDDEAAIAFSTVLYRTYVGTRNLKQSVDTANAHVQSRFPNTPAARLLNGASEELGRFNALLDELRQDIQRLTAMIEDDQRRIAALEEHRAGQSRIGNRQVVMYAVIGAILLSSLAEIVILLAR